MIKNYAGFSTSLEGEELIDYLSKQRNSCSRLSKSYDIKTRELTLCIKKLEEELK